MIDKEILPWLITVPASDINFRNKLKEANLETLQEALKSELSKTAIKLIESQIRRLKNEFSGS